MKTGIKTAAAGTALMALTAATFLPAGAARADDGRFDGRRDGGAPAFHRQDVRVDRDNRSDRSDRGYRDDRDDRFAQDARFRRDAPRDAVVVVRHDDYPVRDGFRGRIDGFRDDRNVVQSTKNNDRNLATLGVAVAAVGVLTHNTTLTTVGAVGAIVGGTAYENARKAQNDQGYGRWGR